MMAVLCECRTLVLVQVLVALLLWGCEAVRSQLL